MRLLLNIFHFYQIGSCQPLRRIAHHKVGALTTISRGIHSSNQPCLYRPGFCCLTVGNMSEMNVHHTPKPTGDWGGVGGAVRKGKRVREWVRPCRWVWVHWVEEGRGVDHTGRYGSQNTGERENIYVWGDLFLPCSTLVQDSALLYLLALCFSFRFCIILYFCLAGDSWVGGGNACFNASPPSRVPAGWLTLRGDS